MNYAVVFTEYDRGWGSNQFHAVFYETRAEAEAKSNAENAKNTAPTAPDYYIQTHVVPVHADNRAYLEKLAK